MRGYYMNKQHIIDWFAAWIIVPVYAMLVCPILWAAEKYEDWRYGPKIEI